ncbi:hypothetical protein [Rhodoplanes elegans]|nr:hypothetical protein [Rhodoplanes elegans]
MSQPDIQEALIEAFEEQALLKLRSVTSLEDYLTFVSAHTFRHKLFDWPEVRIIVDVARGDLAGHVRSAMPISTAGATILHTTKRAEQNISASASCALGSRPMIGQDSRPCCTSGRRSPSGI